MRSWISILLLLTSLFVSATAIEPLAVSSFKDEESLADYRSKNGIKFNFATQHNNPERDRGRNDDKLALEAKQRRNLGANSHGSFKILVLLVAFADHADRELPPLSYWETVFNEKIKPYFLEQSYGAYDITFHIEDWRTVPENEAYYAGGVSNAKDSLEASKMFEPVLDQLAEEGMDFFDFDGDNDGYLDNVIVIHSGFSAAFPGGEKCGNGPQDRIRSQGHTGGKGPNYDSWADPKWGLQLSSYAIASTWERVCNFNNWAGMGVITHEWIHTFG